MAAAACDSTLEKAPLTAVLLTLFPVWPSGKVSVLEDAALDSFHGQIGRPAADSAEDPSMKLSTHDIYKELRLRGYDYGKTFQGILESNNAGACAGLWTAVG